ncbi:MAG: hypothetical protein PHU23_11155 [Dehalococcoidales bacterium]|nr:hypothetical protein [Dehalococcoidales bacterium]
MLDPRNLYVYVVDRDFGFAPNPFHGYCTLATCKPGIRKVARKGDWVMGVGGTRMRATGKCIYLMRVTEILTFDTYWSDIRFRLKRPVRNGSPVMMIGDNIYHKNVTAGDWIQEDSHHSNPDGSTNNTNLETDTQSENVLVSDHFFYFGSAAPSVDLQSINYKNGRNYSKKSLGNSEVAALIKDLEETNWRDWNVVISDPFLFRYAIKRVDQGTGKII